MRFYGPRTVLPTSLPATCLDCWAVLSMTDSGGRGFEPQRLRGISRRFSNQSPMCEVCAPRDLAGFVSTHR